MLNLNQVERMEETTWKHHISRQDNENTFDNFSLLFLMNISEQYNILIARIL